MRRLSHRGGFLGEAPLAVFCGSTEIRASQFERRTYSLKDRHSPLSPSSGHGPRFCPELKRPDIICSQYLRGEFEIFAKRTDGLGWDYTKLVSLVLHSTQRTT